MFDFYDFENDDFPVCSLSVEQWDSLTEEQQEEYIGDNNIKIRYTHDISDTLQRGFGKLHNLGYWEYTCKKI